jgi:NAD+ kinase
MPKRDSIPPVSSVMIYPRDDGPAAWPATERAAGFLLERGCAVAVPASLLEQGALSLPDGVTGIGADDAKALAGLDLMIALGGDGTLLRASRWVADHGVPVCGVNLGDLGFLSAYGRESLQVALEDALEGRLAVEPRLRMRIDVYRNGRLHATDTASNDAYVKHGEIPRLLRMATYIGEQFMATYRADGLIICTPLGSTAYNLAAGGPIIEPGTGAFTVTPICPHSLTLRPVVASAEAEIKLIYEGPRDVSSAFLTSDGQWSLELELGDEILIRRADVALRLVPPLTSVFEVLSTKLGWSSGGTHSTPGTGSMKGE